MFSVSPDDLKLSHLSVIDADFADNPVADSVCPSDLQRCRALHYRAIFNVFKNRVIASKVLKKINAKIKKINQKIAAYNDIENLGNAQIYIHKKINQLRMISKLYQALDYLQNDVTVLQFPSYQVVLYDKFSADLARQRDCLSLTWQYEIIPAALLRKPRFQEFFADIPYAAVQAIMNELLENRRLSSVVFQDQKSVLAKSFKQLIARHTLTPLGHSHVRCFVLKEKSTGEKTVLKIENSLNRPKYIELKLRKLLENVPTMQDFLLPIYFERRVMYFDREFGHLIGRFILTQYCNQGRLFNYVLKRVKACKDHLEFVLDLILLLGEKLERLQQNGFANTNLNGTTILVHIDEHASAKKMTLHMSDCNAFYECDAEGRLLVPPGSTIAFTPYLSAPENNAENANNTECYADKIHVYQLGRCLYECLICYEPEILAEYHNEKRKVNEFYASHFKSLVFKRIPTIDSHVGYYLQRLIARMVVVDPQKRVSLHDALSRLTNIKNVLGKHTSTLDALRIKLEGIIQESSNMLDALLKQQFGNNDLEIIDYVKNQSKFLVLDISKAEDIITRYGDIQTMLADLNTKDLRRIRQTIKQLRQQTHDLPCAYQNNFFKGRDNKRALAIEAVMRKIPIGQRKDIRSRLTSESLKIQKIFQSVWPSVEPCSRPIPPNCC